MVGSFIWFGRPPQQHKEKEMNVLFLAPPGAGKSTQAKLIQKRLGIPHLSTGDMLREAKEQGTEAGLKAAEYFDQGNLAPDDLVIKIVEDWLSQEDCQFGALWDGFPRNKYQAQALETMLMGRGQMMDRVIALSVKEEKLISRLLARGRADDTEETIQHRIQVYHEQTLPVFDYYKGHIDYVDGNGTSEEVDALLIPILNSVQAQELDRWHRDERDIKKHIRTIPNFPVEGILFRDITPLLAAPRTLEYAIEKMYDAIVEGKVGEPDVIVAAEARGFIFAVPLAMQLDLPFIPIRKPGKLPADTHVYHYDLEYGQDTLEVHQDAIKPGQKVLIVDDLLATGGTILACCNLIEQSGAEVAGCSFLIELRGLKGAERLAPHKVHSLIQYD